METTFKARGIGHSFDWRLIGIYLSLIFIGLINIYASVHSSEPSSIFDTSVRSGMQCLWIATSFGLAAIIVFLIPFRIWESAAIPMYIAVLLLLVAVIFMGVEVKGSRSWFDFGAVRFQPAEISKITTSLMLSFVISRTGFRMSRIKDFVKIGLVLGIPMMIILAENETGSALVYMGFLFVLYREGMSGWILTFLGVSILMFVLTLTASPYTAIVVLIALVMLPNALRSRGGLKTFALCTLVIIALACLPGLWRSVTEPGIAEEAVAESVIDDTPDVPAELAASADEEASEPGIMYSILSKFKPMYILMALVAICIPYFCYKAYRQKNRFLFLSVIAAVSGIVLVFSTDIIFNKVLQEHQRKRIEVLLGIKEDPTGVGYNVNQSMIAIGSGGLTGKGFLNGTQTSYGFVPEQSTDFIFCTVGEEWGFLGCLLVIGLYIALIWRIVSDAEHSREHFTRIYGYCVAACLFMHLFINIGMTIGLMPVIGIPLPMMSYGGSSLWAFTIMIFIFVVLDHQEKKYF